jgi:ornithine carbamoyltransferase
MFLGQNDIHLGVNEPLRDTSTIIASMTASMIARVAAHAEVQELARYSSVPVINALSDDFHPLQTLADFLTIHEAFPSTPKRGLATPSLGLEGMKICWVGDANNVLFDLCTAAMKLGVHIAHAAPRGYGIPTEMKEHILSAREGVASPGTLTETNIPEEAVKDVDVIFTDTWISMGWEAERQERMKAFQGFGITEELAKRGGAKEGWRFMHCLPRHPEEVSDEVFYGPRSLVFDEGNNRMWTTIGEFF